MNYGEIHLSPMGLRFAGRIWPCTIGRNGISDDKREGDGATPSGRLHVMGMLYRPDRIRADLLPDWAEPIRLGDLWCDAPEEPEYNHLTRAPFRPSHEALRRADPLYDLILITDWNWPEAEAGKGSAIFLHRWRRPGFPTAGCIAMSPENLLWLAQRVSRGTPIVVPSAARWTGRGVGR